MRCDQTKGWYPHISCVVEGLLTLFCSVYLSLPTLCMHNFSNTDIPLGVFVSGKGIGGPWRILPCAAGCRGVSYGSMPLTRPYLKLQQPVSSPFLANISYAKGHDGKYWLSMHTWRERNGPSLRFFFTQWCLQLGGVSLQGKLITVLFRHIICLHINPFYTSHMASKYTHVTRTFGGKSMLQKINPPTVFQILFPQVLHCLHAIVIHQMKDKECSISNIWIINA